MKYLEQCFVDRNCYLSACYYYYFKRCILLFRNLIEPFNSIYKRQCFVYQIYTPSKGVFLQKKLLFLQKNILYFKKYCCGFKSIDSIQMSYWLFVFTQLSNSKKCCHLDKILKLFISHNYAPSLGPSWYSSHSSSQLAYS